MNTNANTPNKTISDNERQAFQTALFLYYTQGPPITRAFDQVESGLIDRYYRRKKRFPEEIKRIDREARRMAASEIAGDKLAADSEAIRFSAVVQREAREALMAALPHLASIARGEVFVIDLGEKDGNPVLKRIIPYPRDIVAAVSVLRDIARVGVQPEHYRMPSVEPEVEEEEPRKPMIPVLGIGADFTSITATRPDGTKFTAEVKPEDLSGRLPLLLTHSAAQPAPPLTCGAAGSPLSPRLPLLVTAFSFCLWIKFRIAGLSARCCLAQMWYNNIEGQSRFWL